MSRPPTGAVSTKGAFRITMILIREAGLFIEGFKKTIQIRFNNGYEIYQVSATIDYSSDNPYLILRGENNLETYVYIERRISNIGKGYIYYFVCPQTARRCRTLYKCYGSPIFKSLNAYRTKIYYPSQLRSNWNERYWDIDAKLGELYSGRATYTYNGKQTRRAKRIESWERKQHRAHEYRLSELIKRL